MYCQYYSFVAGFEPVFCALRLTSGGSGGASVCEWLKEEDSYEGIERRSPNRLERGKKNPGGGSRQEAYSDSELEDPTYYPSGLQPRTKSNTKMSHKKSRREDTEDVEQAGDLLEFLKHQERARAQEAEERERIRKEEAAERERLRTEKAEEKARVREEQEMVRKQEQEERERKWQWEQMERERKWKEERELMQQRFELLIKRVETTDEQH